MSEHIESYTLSGDFPSGLTNHRLETAINANVNIGPLCKRVDTFGNNVSIVFDVALNAGEKTELNGEVSGHNSATLYSPIVLTIDPSDDILKCLEDDDTLVRVETNINHDLLNGYVANEHIDWTIDAGAFNINSNNITASSVTQHESGIDHGSIAGLGDDDHSQYALLGGRGGGQTIIGGSAANEDLTLESTSNISKGTIILLNPVKVNDLDTRTATTLLLGKSTATKLELADTGIVTEVQGNLDALEGLDVTGNITVSGTVDGRDIAADGAAHDSHISATAAHGATGAIMGTTNAQTITNKTITDTSNNVASKSLHSATTVIDVSAAAAPTSGQFLTATSGTAAAWQSIFPGTTLDKEVVIFSGTGGSSVVGSGRRDYGAQASDPSSPTPQAGDRYYNTAINHEMVYDGTRGKWLSMTAIMDGGGRNGITYATTYYRRWNGMIMSATLGPYVPKGTIVYIGFTCATTGIHTLEVLVDGVVITELSSGGAAINSDATINADFNAGVMSFRNKTGSVTTSNFQCNVYYKLRA